MTKISWCDETINPVVGCTAVSAGCQNCYAEKMARRLAAMGREQYKNVINQHGEWEGLTEFVPSELKKPYKWKKPRSIFISSMGDLFHDTADHRWQDDVMRMVWDNPRHTFIILTKRPENMLHYFQGLATPGADSDTSRRLLKNPNYAQQDHGWRMKYLKGGSLPNLAIGVSVENQQTADERIYLLQSIPAAKLFISLEPMIGPVNLMLGCIRCGHLTDAECPGSSDACRMIRPLDGVILGGESGNKARYLDPQWVRSVRDQCKYAGVPFMFKQWSAASAPGRPWEYNDESGFPLLDGRTHTDLPWETRKPQC